MTVAERYGRAVAAGRTHVRLDRDTDADAVLAAGKAASTGSALGHLLSRIRGGDATEYRSAMMLMLQKAASKYRRKPKQWPDGPDFRRHLGQAAQVALDYWIDSQCRSCKGIKYELIAGTPYKSANVCNACNGTGRRPIPKTLPEPARQMVENNLLRMLEESVSEFEYHQSRQLRSTD